MPGGACDVNNTVNILNTISRQLPGNLGAGSDVDMRIVTLMQQRRRRLRQRRWRLRASASSNLHTLVKPHAVFLAQDEMQDEDTLAKPICRATMSAAFALFPMHVPKHPRGAPFS